MVPDMVSKSQKHRTQSEGNAKCTEGSAKCMEGNRSVQKATEVYRRQQKCTEGNRSVQKATEKTLYNSTLVDFYANRSSGKVRFLYVWQRTLFEKSLSDKEETTNRFEIIKKQHFGQISTVSNIIFWQRLVQGQTIPVVTHISLQ